MAAPRKVRFAPSPNGPLHLGHAYSALFTEHAAKSLGARLIVRMEDIDCRRCRPEFAEAALFDLNWLGIRSHEPVRYQSRHMDVYRSALERLREMRLLYPCFASRMEIRNAIAGRANHPADPDGSPIYPGLCKNMADEERARRIMAGHPYSLRLDLERALSAARKAGSALLTFTEEGSGPAGEAGTLAIRPELWGDVVLARKDIGVSYHIAVVVDDALQGISHVTRGHDLFHATHIHRLLQVILELPEPRYRHHRLIGDAAGRKLSKSAGDTGLRTLREQGVSAAEIRAELGFARISTD